MFGCIWAEIFSQVSHVDHVTGFIYSGTEYHVYTSMVDGYDASDVCSNTLGNYLGNLDTFSIKLMS